jgi:O-acetylhomoserine/O-acetylserine sulfhydrylase-like pyridoxal-dependent enzyme
LKHRYQFSTQAIHTGGSEHISATPIYQAATVNGVYLRSGNPTIDVLETRITALEGGKSAIATSSGTSAISQTLVSLLSAGDRIVCHQTIYTWTREILNTYLTKFGVEVVYIDMRDLGQLQQALQSPTRLVYFEPVCNPTVDIIDAESVIRMTQTVGATAVVDNTWPPLKIAF